MFPAPLGEMEAIFDADGILTRLGFERSAEPYLDTMNLAQTDSAELLKRELNDYFTGTLKTFSVPIALYGTPFQMRVWSNLAEIPYGVTTTYGQVAKNLGDAKLSRAVGMANGANPISIIIPCHRVIGAGGKLTGYGGGLWRKAALLKLEGCTVQEPQRRALASGKIIICT
ncbi:MAG: methylated-DNA--[protein]-cysteine S-methyltransferase [Holophagales bacterium]|jgi:methylated-DNA-[protein]-cysteine S-methyltransferase|nr:methylated-DNA--[protein]-cysteine S-methyltransferase [Holophagales bacterium]